MSKAEAVREVEEVSPLQVFEDVEGEHIVAVLWFIGDRGAYIFRSDEIESSEMDVAFEYCYFHPDLSFAQVETVRKVAMALCGHGWLPHITHGTKEELQALLGSALAARECRQEFKKKIGVE